tara:strand:- start:140 stop:490 length:351 start_codon:yes stop_codon:yes gene_type:complete
MEPEEQGGVKVVERSSKEIWQYERQIELLSNRIKELEEAGEYCVSGQNRIQPQHKAEHRQLREAVSILQQKAAGIVNPRPKVAVRKPRAERRRPRTDEEWEALATEFAKVRAEAGL